MHARIPVYGVSPPPRRAPRECLATACVHPSPAGMHPPSQPLLGAPASNTAQALGAAKGLLYLHTRQPPVIHRDLVGWAALSWYWVHVAFVRVVRLGGTSPGRTAGVYCWHKSRVAASELWVMMNEPYTYHSVVNAVCPCVSECISASVAAEARSSRSGWQGLSMA